MPRRKGWNASKGSKTEAVLEFVLTRRSRDISANAVADALGLDRKVVATLLARLASEGRIKKRGRGMYSASGRPTGRSTKGRLQVKADDGWKRAYEELSKEMGQALGPAADRIREVISEGRTSGFRQRTEELVKELREDLGGRLALDMVQPVLEDIFGENGRETAVKLCFPDGGGPI